MIPVTAALLLAACSESPPSAAAAAPFVPERWFLGHTTSSGELRFINGKMRVLHVDSDGRAESGGWLRFDQAIRWEAGGVDHRFWRIRRTGEGYTVTLSDAAGAVAFEVQGARVHLKYRMKSRAPLTMEQWMDLQPDGRTLDNRGTVCLLGLPVARLKETIVHDPF